MNAKEISKTNISQVGYSVGKSIKGKGTEIFTSKTTAFHKYTFGGRFDEKEINRALEALNEKFVDETLFSYEIRGKNGDLQTVSKEEAIAELSNTTSIKITRLPELLGYISLSKYEGDLSSQKQLVIDVCALEGYKVCDEFLESSYDDLGDTINFNEGYRGTKYSGDYALMHGSQLCFDEGSSQSIDARISNYNERVVEDFWDLDYDCEKEYFASIDPEETVSVYHYKGKRFYISPSLKEEEIYLTYKRGEDLCEGEYFRIFKWNENKELLAKIESTIMDTLKDLEIKGYISNELERGDGESNDDIFNLGLIDAYYDEDRYEALMDLTDLVDFEKYDGSYNSERPLVESAYEEWLKKNIIGTELDDGRLGKLDSMAKAMDYTIAETAIPGSQKIQTCVKYKNEEYHFSLGELYNAESVEDFFSDVAKKLQKRLLEKLSESVLFEKAEYVFVGLNDSYESGNCQSGTKAFCDRHHIDTSVIGGIRGSDLLSLEITNFTKRAVMAAIARQGAHHV